MKKALSIFIVLFFTLSATAQSNINKQVVEASCGQCNFGLKSKAGCDLAVRIDGVAYFVDGVKIDNFGDAHAKDGFCNAIRKAEVSGKIKKNRFVASSFTLLPEEKKD